MKSPSERGVIGAWAYQARNEVGLSVEQVAERVSAKGQAVTPSTIRGIESGNKKPGARLLRLLGQVLETEPPRTAPAAAEQTDLAAAIDRQARAIEGLVAELREWRTSDRDRIAGLENLVGAVVATVGPLAPVPAAPRAPLAPGR